MKFTKQSIDKISELLADDKVNIDFNMENAIIEALTEGHNIPSKWKKATFSPSRSVDDCIQMIRILYPTIEFSLVTKVIEGGPVFIAWVSKEEYSVWSTMAARALFRAMWNCYRLEHDTNEE